MKIKKILLLSLTMLLSLSAFGSSEPSVLFVEMKNGDVKRFALSTKPKVTFDAKFLNISTGNFSVQYDEVKRFYLSQAGGDTPVKPDDPIVDAIESAKTVTLNFQYDGNTVIIEGAETKDFQGLFSIDGKKQGAYVTGADGRICIDLTALPSNIYIIKVNKQSFKIKR